MVAASSNSSSGINTPIFEQEAIAPVHPTAARREYPVVVQGEATAYSDEHITATFTNRGANVVLQDGKYIVKPTATTYSLQTERKVAKTG
jgi:myo-inositol-1-phosphate synthase